MRIIVDPLTVAVALGLLNPAALDPDEEPSPEGEPEEGE